MARKPRKDPIVFLSKEEIRAILETANDYEHNRWGHVESGL